MAHFTPEPDTKTETRNPLPMSILLGVLGWIILLVLYVIDGALARFTAEVVAGVILTGSFTLIGWYSQRVGVIPPRAHLRRALATHTSASHIIYTTVVFVIAGFIGGGSVFGATFAASGITNLLLVAGVGVIFGLVMCLGLELDVGIMDVGIVDRGAWSLGFSLILALCVWSILFAIFAAAGAGVFITTVILLRVLFSAVIYRLAPMLLERDDWEHLGDYLLALSVILLPLVAYLSTQ